MNLPVVPPRLRAALRRTACALTLGLVFTLPVPTLLAQSPAPTTAAGEDWSFPFTPEPSLYSGLFRMGPTSAPSGMVRQIGRTLSWASLNPAENTYDFSYVDSVLSAAATGNYSVIFRLKSSVYNGSEQGQGGSQSQMIPQWVVTKYNLTSGYTFNTASGKTYAAPWHPGVQAEFHKFLQEIGRRKLVQSPHVFAFYLHGFSSSDGEELGINSSTYTSQAATTAVNAGYTGSVHGSPLADAIMDCFQTRMEWWVEAAGPYAYKIIWVGAGGVSGLTYPRTLLNNYAITLGLGARHGFIEHYYYGAVQPPIAGQNYDGTYVTSDWSHPLRDGRYWGDENEETDEYQNPFDSSQILGAGEARDLAYRSSFFRAAQLGMNFLWTENTPIDRAGNNNGNYTDDPLPIWFTLVAGKPAAESPDAVAWLRQANVRKMPAPPWTDQEVTQSDPAQPWRNLERLLMQRDIAGAITQPARYLNMPHVMNKVENYSNPDSFAEYTARRTDVATGNRNIAFKLDPVFRTSLGSTSVKVKVIYFDELGTAWNVRVAKGSGTPVTLGTVTNGTSNTWRTATFTLTSGNAPFQPGGSGSPLGDGIDFVINVPSGSNNVTVRYVRVVRSAEVAVAPSIKVHPITQSIPLAGTTLHVVPKGPPPYTYQWKKNGANISGATGISLARTQADAGSYTVVVTNAAGSVTSNAAVLSVGGYSSSIDDFEDGNVTSPTPWTSAVGSGPAVSITAAAVTGSEPAAHSGSTYHALIDFGSTATWRYAVLNRGAANFGTVWSANGVDAIRLYIKGSVANPVSIANNAIKLQLREGDTGDRWSYDIGTVVQNNNSTWSQLTIPLSAFYGESSNPGGAALNLGSIDQVRLFVNGVGAQIKVRVDKLEAIVQ